MTRLGLRLIICTEEDLVSFLVDHRATLEVLSLQDLILRDWKHRWHSIIYYDDSIIRLLWLLKHMLTLDHLVLRGYLANDGTECWVTDAGSQNGILLDKAVGSICRAGTFLFQDYISYLLPAAWLRLVDARLAGYGTEVDECQPTTALVTASSLRIDALVSLVKTDLRDFSCRNTSAIADCIPASQEGFDSMLRELKAFSDESWKLLRHDDSLRGMYR